jgi:hypothetical protein
MLFTPAENSADRLRTFAAAAAPQIDKLLAATLEAR